MNRKSQLTLIAAAAIAALGFYGVAHSKMQADSGFHILNKDSDSYTTQSAGCNGINWPTPIASGNADPSEANKIKVVGKVTEDRCSTTYTSSADSSKTCNVILSMTNGTIQAVMADNQPNCTTVGQTNVVLGSS